MIMSEKSNANSVAIIVALITTVGVISAAIIGNWDRIRKWPPPVDLSGTWYVQTTTKETSYKPFEDLVLRYKILLTHDEKGITASGNKIGEVCDEKVMAYSGKLKTPIQLTGSLGKDAFGVTEVRFNGQEGSPQGNSYGTAFQLRMLTDSQMLGTFSGIIAKEAFSEIHLYSA